METPKYSFVILTFNSDKFILKCLSSLNKAIEQSNHKAELFVVDNGSVDKTLSIVNRFQFSKNIKLELVSFKENKGTTYSRNVAIKKSTGQYIVIMDSDAYINHTSLDVLSNFLKNNIHCGLAVPKIIYPDGRYQLSTDTFPTLIRKIQRFLFLKKIESKEVICGTINVDYAISAFWMLPKYIVDKVGLLDEKIFYSPEDVDYCIRIWKSGYEISYINECEVIHDAQEISRPKGFKIVNLFSLSHLKGLLYLYVKHKFLFSGRKFRS